MPPEGAAGSAKIIRLAEVLERTALSRTTIWRKVHSGDFPAPIVLGPNSVGWPEHEIEAWVQSRPRVTYASSPQGGAANQVVAPTVSRGAP